jgi:hypothetical protein
MYGGKRIRAVPAAADTPIRARAFPLLKTHEAHLYRMRAPLAHA